MRLLVCGGAGFIGSTFARQRLLEHGDEVTVLDKLTYAGREENLQDLAEHGRLPLPARGDRGPRRRRRRDRGRHARGDRQLRRRDPRRPLDHRARCVRLDPCARYLRAARGGTQPRAALPAGVHRRGLRLDRRRHLHRGLSPAAILAVLGDQGRRRPAGPELLPHLRAVRRSSVADRTTTGPTSIRRS